MCSSVILLHKEFRFLFNVLNNIIAITVCNFLHEIIQHLVRAACLYCFNLKTYMLKIKTIYKNLFYNNHK